jgi:hypothetical protein
MHSLHRGGEIPPDYYVVGLEDQLSSVPDEETELFGCDSISSHHWIGRKKRPLQKIPSGTEKIYPKPLCKPMLRIAMPRSGESRASETRSAAHGSPCFNTRRKRKASH